MAAQNVTMYGVSIESTTQNRCEIDEEKKNSRNNNTMKPKRRRKNNNNKCSTQKSQFDGERGVKITCSIIGFVCWRSIDQNFAIGIGTTRCDCCWCIASECAGCRCCCRCWRRCGWWCLWLQHNVFRFYVLDGIVEIVHFFVVDGWH